VKSLGTDSRKTFQKIKETANIISLVPNKAYVKLISRINIRTSLPHLQKAVISSINMSPNLATAFSSQVIRVDEIVSKVPTLKFTLR